MLKNRQVRLPLNLIQKKINFFSIFIDTVPNFSFIWQLVDESSKPETLLNILQGQLIVKDDDTDQWLPYVCMLQSDRFYRQTNGMQDYGEYIHLSACFVKKYDHTDSRMPNYRFGIRLQQGNQTVHLLAESQESFKKWYNLLRRYCVLEKFSRKYKIMTKLRYQDPIFGQVYYSCIRIQDARFFMVRIIQKETLNNQQLHYLFKEVQNLRKLHHSQLIFFVEIYEDENNLYLIFENYIGYDLKTHLREAQILQQAELSVYGLDEKLLSNMILGLIQAINHMHSRGVFHRDIKLDNIFIPEKQQLPFVVLANFCYSESFRLTQQQSALYKKCGTPGYVAPEVFKTKQYDQKVDIFALGVVFYILVYGRMPFDGMNSDELLKQNEKEEIDFKLEKRLCKKISQSGLDLMKAMLQRDPSKRPNSQQCLNHHWFIKMKSKNERTTRQNKGNRSLSTIVEGTEILDQTQSFLQSNFNNSQFLKRNMSQKRFTSTVKTLPQELDINERIEREFEPQDTLSDKINMIKSFSSIKQPSKKYRDISQTQIYEKQT